MEEWKVYKIKDICKGIYEGPHATPKESQTGGIYLGIPAISTDGHINFRNAKRIAEEDLPLWTKRVTPQEDDIVFTNEATLNLYALIPAGFHGCLGRRLGLVRPNKELVNAKYLFYYFFSPEWRNVISQNKVYGATVERILMTKFPSFPIKLPSLSIQNSIVNILSSLDDKIEVNRKINENLEQQAQALFKSWFVDFEPFKDGEFVESELGLIPKEWRVEKLGDVCKCVLGGTPSRNKPEYWDGDIAWINSGEVNKFRITTPSEYITVEGLNHSATKLLPKKTTVLAITGATLGQVSLLEIDTCANQSVIGVLENDENPYSFVYPLIKERIGELMSHMTGGAQQHINKNNVEGLDIVIPTHDVMDSFRDITFPIYEKIGNLCQENDRLATLRDTLLPKLMSGELKVNEVEI